MPTPTRSRPGRGSASRRGLLLVWARGQARWIYYRVRSRVEWFLSKASAVATKKPAPTRSAGVNALSPKNFLFSTIKIDYVHMRKRRKRGHAARRRKSIMSGVGVAVGRTDVAGERGEPAAPLFFLRLRTDGAPAMGAGSARRGPGDGTGAASGCRRIRRRPSTITIATPRPTAIGNTSRRQVNETQPHPEKHAQANPDDPGNLEPGRAGHG